MNTVAKIQLPGLDCGDCGFRECAEFAARLADSPELILRCTHLSNRDATPTCGAGQREACLAPGASSLLTGPCGACPGAVAPAAEATWLDSLGREFDFYLEHFPEDPGPREVISPHNPIITREMDVRPGDVLIGRPLGISCGCPITHCGHVVEADHRTGVITWCVTGPLAPREKGCKDIGYYTAEAYEGLAVQARSELRIGMRYWFQPRMCMLQWRHSGLVNYLNKLPNGCQVRIEGLYIG